MELSIQERLKDLRVERGLTLEQLADGVPVTKEMIVALNPKRSEWDEIKAELDEIGYLNKL